MNRSNRTCIEIAISLCLATAAANAQSSRVTSDTPSPATAKSSASSANSVRVQFDLPAQALAESLRAIGKRTDTNILIDLKMVENLQAPPLKASLTADEAMARILGGTQIRHRFIDPQTVVLSTGRPVAAKSVEPAAGPLRFTPGEGQNTEGPGADPQSEASESGSEAMPGSLEEIGTTRSLMPEVLVKGSRVTLNADIERTEDDVQPYVVFTAEEVQRSMAVNVEDFLKNRLPMNTSSSTNRQSTRSGSNVSEFNLRGLGADETLVLVNGRRLASVSNIANGSSNSSQSSNFSFGQPDVNGIPLASIERIEVLPATAAGIYGGGATGGVINIILKTNYSGLDVSADYSNTFDTDSAGKRWSANGGFSLEGGKTSIAFSGSYSEQNDMLVRDRDFTRRSRQRQLRNSPESYYSNQANDIPVGFTPNIKNNAADCSSGECVYANLILDDGLVDIGSPITHIPVDYNGDLQQLIANSGTYNLDLANDISNGSRSIQSGPRVSSLNLTINRQFSDAFSMFANVSRAENRGSIIFAGLPNSAEIAADAPTNPFTTNIRVSYPVPGFAFQQDFASDSLNAVVGAAIRLPFRWQAQLEANWGKSRTVSDGGSPFLIEDIRDPSGDGSIVRTGLITSISNGTVDVLRDLNRELLDLSEFALPYPNAGMSPADSLSTGGLLRLSGPLFSLPAGEVVLSALLDRRKDEAEEAITRSQAEALGSNLFFFYPGRETTTDSVYLEANVPLISALNERPWLRILDVQASVRRDSNKTRSVPTGGFQILDANDRPDSLTYTESTETATGYTLGFRAAPIRDLTFRMSFGHGFLPPSIAQIGSTTVNTGSAQFGISDPLRLYEEIGTQGDATIVLEGNPNLKSESSDSFSTGLILTPRFLEGLRLSVDYTQIKKTDEISSIDYDLLIRHPELYPGRVVRGPELGDGLPGPITYLDTTLINIDRTTVKALDLQLNYSLPTQRAGSFTFYAVATRQNEYSRRLTQISSVQNSIGFKDGPLKWRGNAGIDWYKGALSVGWNMQYFTSYLVYQSTDDPASADYVVDIQGSRSIPAQRYHDISFRYWFGDGLFAKVRAFQGVVMTGGIQNVLNTSPPIDITNGDDGYSPYGDPLLRRYTLQLTKSF